MGAWALESNQVHAGKDFYTRRTHDAALLPVCHGRILVAASGASVMGRSIQSRLKEKRLACPSLQQAAAIKARPPAAERGYDAAWQKLRAQHLAKQPYCQCEQCKRLGLSTKANTVDHIVPHRGDDRLRLDPNNLQSMTRSHHSTKTNKYDGGFGNKKR